MDKIDWKRKLTSRKFWVAVAAFISLMIVAFGGDKETATEVTAIIMAGATVVGYIIGEGLTDAAHTSTGVIEGATEIIEEPTEAE